MLQRHCFSFFSTPNSDGSAQSETIALIVLNAPIDPTDTLFQNAWDNASLRVAADGGADRLAALSVATGRSYIPDAVVGDMDSASPSTLASLKDIGVDIVPVPDQDSTDLDKSINYITHTRGLGTLPPQSPSLSHKAVLPSPVGAIVCHGAFGGRFDQQMSCIAALYSHCRALNPSSAVETQTAARLVLLGDGNAAELLPPGAHTLHPPVWSAPLGQDERAAAAEVQGQAEGEAEAVCSYYSGFFPLNWAAPHARVVSSGFTWDLGSQRAQQALAEALASAVKAAGDEQAAVAAAERLVVSVGGADVSVVDVGVLSAVATAEGAAMGLGGLVSTSNRIPAPAPAAADSGAAAQLGAALLTDQPLVFTASFGLRPRP